MSDLTHQPVHTQPGHVNSQAQQQQQSNNNNKKHNHHHHRNSPIQEKEGHMLCVDPISKKMNIPLECISETLAKYRQGVPSLCMLYLNNRCRQGQNCHQVHADPAVVLAMREKAQEKMVCCMEHSSQHHSGKKGVDVEQRIKEVYQVTFVNGSGAVFPITKCAMTPGLQCYIDEYEQKYGKQDPAAAAGEDDSTSSGSAEVKKVTLSPNVTTLCRLHGQDRCRYGDDCKFVHMCKELLFGELAASGAPPISREYYRNTAANNNGGGHHHMSNSMMKYGSNNNNLGGGLYQQQYDSEGITSLAPSASVPSFYPSSPTQQGFTPYPGNQAFQQRQQQQQAGSNNNSRSGWTGGVKQLSHESLISMDLTSTPPLTPTSPPIMGASSAYSTPSHHTGNKSPVVKSRDAGDSWSYEVYGFNPIPMMPPAMEA